MRLDIFRNAVTALAAATVIASCAPQTPATPTVDIVGTAAAQMASVMLTQTAGAVTPTPPAPTETATPAITDTPAVPTEKPALSPPSVVKFAGCWAGPGESYTLISNIDPSIRKAGRQVVTILGVGSEPGWYIIRNPYFNNPCWIRAENMEIDPLMDLSQFPVMTPPPP
ncbi:MAG: hypothetical protein HND47_15020 [Chloroflexi bacterium]|nr:hypothetical protein [Chloroflexota bacterium]